MHAFRLSATAGPACTAAPEGTSLDALCMVNDDDTERARDGALLALNALGFEACTFLDVARLPESADVSRYSPPMRQAMDDARRDGVAVLLYGRPGVN